MPIEFDDIKSLLELIILALGVLAAISVPFIVQWGKKYFGSAEDHISAEKARKAAVKRIEALEKEDLQIRNEMQLMKAHHAAEIARCAEELKRIEMMDRRIYRIAVMLAQMNPEAARDIKLLEDL